MKYIKRIEKIQVNLFPPRGYGDVVPRAAQRPLLRRVWVQWRGAAVGMLPLQPPGPCQGLRGRECLAVFVYIYLFCYYYLFLQKGKQHKGGIMMNLKEHTVAAPLKKCQIVLLCVLCLSGIVIFVYSFVHHLFSPGGHACHWGSAQGKEEQVEDFPQVAHEILHPVRRSPLLPRGWHGESGEKV